MPIGTVLSYKSYIFAHFLFFMIAFFTNNFSTDKGIAPY